MKYLFIIAIISLLYSCSPLRVTSNKTAGNTPSLGIDWAYAGKMDQSYKPMIDSSLFKKMEEFNMEKHAFTVHKKQKEDQDFLNLCFENGKIVSKRERTWAYVFLAVGQVALPATLMAVNSNFITGFAYIPYNKIKAYVYLSPGMSDNKTRNPTIRIRTNPLFANRQRKLDKTVKKFSKRFYKTLLTVERQIKN